MVAGLVFGWATIAHLLDGVREQIKDKKYLSMPPSALKGGRQVALDIDLLMEA
jgi:hypothetical protein